MLALLNADRRIVLAAWVHDLAIDSPVGSRILTEARSHGIAPLWHPPPALLTFLFGPAGWLWSRLQVRLLGQRAA